MIPLSLPSLALIALTASTMPIAVAVVAPPNVTDSLVNRICVEAEAIWAPAGIVLEWNRDASRDEVAPRRLEIAVTIDDRPAPAGRHGALGWLTFAADGPERLIHLSRASAEELLRNTPGLIDATITSHDAYVARALGRAFAHEMGHYILRSKVHTPRGLMRAAWTASQAFATSRDGFALTAEERAEAADNLRMELKRADSAP